jgi:hypothetical protein
MPLRHPRCVPPDFIAATSPGETSLQSSIGSAAISSSSGCIRPRTRGTALTLTMNPRSISVLARLASRSSRSLSGATSSVVQLNRA